MSGREGVEEGPGSGGAGATGVAATATTDPAADVVHGPLRPVSLAVLGLAMGTWASVCGIGGGLFAVPLLHYVYRIPLREAVATGLVLVAATTTSATASEVLRDDSALHLPTVLGLLAASLVGARLGFSVSQRVPVARLKQVFAVVLVLVALRLLLGDRPQEHVGGIALWADLGYGVREYATVAATGLVAGFVAPLLGVGGGLVAVPALVLLVEPLGYLGARAASLAMSLCNAWLSIALYQRIGGVRWTYGTWLAVGALGGAVLGVWTVHHPGVVPVARALLAVTLALVSGRFALDAWRAGRAGPQA